MPEISSVETEASGVDENPSVDADIDQLAVASTLFKGKNMNSFQLFIYCLFIHTPFRYLESYIWYYPPRLVFFLWNCQSFIALPHPKPPNLFPPLQKICITCKTYEAVKPNLITGSQEAIARRYSVKKLLLKILQNLQKNTCTSLFLNKVAGWSLQLY